MSHPIDEYFKNGLKDKSYDGHDKDWKGAKTLLGFGSRRKKRIFFLWWLGVLSLFGAVAAMYYLSQTNPKITEQYASESEKSPAIKKTDKVDQSFVSTASLILNTEEDQKENNADIQIDVIRNKEPESNTHEEKQEHELPFTFQKLASHSVKTNSTHIPPKIALYYSADLQALRPLSLMPFVHVLPDVRVPEYDHLTSDNEYFTNTKIGLYAVSDPIESWGLGVMGLLNFKKNWSLDIGLGLNRGAMGNMNKYEDVQLINQRSGLGQLANENNYTYYGFNLPIRLHYRVKRSSFFIGGMVERPFALSGRQEVTVTQELVDPDLQDPSGAPVLGAQNDDVITTVQVYSIESVPELDRYFVYGQLGYSYLMTKRVRLNAASTYRFTKRATVSPLFNDINQISTSDQRWGLLLRVDYIF